MKPFDTVDINVKGINCKIYSSFAFIIAGYLYCKDIEFMTNEGYLNIFKKNEKFIGLYGDMEYKVTNYTENYAIPIKLSRPIAKLLQALTFG